MGANDVWAGGISRLQRGRNAGRKSFRYDTRATQDRSNESPSQETARDKHIGEQGNERAYNSSADLDGQRTNKRCDGHNRQLANQWYIEFSNYAGIRPVSKYVFVNPHGDKHAQFGSTQLFYDNRAARRLRSTDGLGAGPHQFLRRNDDHRGKS